MNLCHTLNTKKNIPKLTHAVNKKEKFALRLARALINAQAMKYGLGSLGITQNNWAPAFFICKPIINKYINLLIDQTLAKVNNLAIKTNRHNIKM